MTTIACLAAFFGASACWGVIGYVLGYKRGRIPKSTTTIKRLVLSGGSLFLAPDTKVVRIEFIGGEMKTANP